MKKNCADLVVGDVMATGEVIEGLRKVGSFQNVKRAITLRNPKTGKVRTPHWGYFSTINGVKAS